jgi:hypothetical protein
MSTSFWDHPIETIEKALQIRKQIEALRESLSEIYNGAGKRASGVSGKKVDGRKGKRSAAVRAKMVAAQRARWAKKHGKTPVGKAEVKAEAKGPRKKRTMSPEARAKIAAAQRARWAKQKTPAAA